MDWKTFYFWGVLRKGLIVMCFGFFRLLVVREVFFVLLERGKWGLYAYKVNWFIIIKCINIYIYVYVYKKISICLLKNIWKLLKEVKRIIWIYYYCNLVYIYF